MNEERLSRWDAGRVLRRVALVGLTLAGLGPGCRKPPEGVTSSPDQISNLLGES